MSQNLEKKYCVFCTTELEAGMFNSAMDQNNMFTIPFCPNSRCGRYGLLSTAFIPEKTIDKYRKDKSEAERQGNQNKKTSEN